MDFPRMQIAILAATLSIAHLLFLDFYLNTTWVLVSATALCLFWQLWWILPYTFLWPKEVKTSKDSDPDRQLSVITSNVLKTNRNSDALIDLITNYQPDILVTLESDRWWEDRLKELETFMPHSVKCPLDNLYGMHVYSRLPFCEKDISYLVEKDVPSIHVSLELRTGDKVRMHFVHPAPPSPTENPESAERDAELITIARSIAETDQPVVVTGDLNDVAWSATTRLFRKISGLLDPRVGRGMFNTFHVDYFFLRWPLDHLFHSPHFTLKSIQRLPPIGSDHFALFTTLMFTPVPDEDQDGLNANKTDHEKAKKISAEMGVSKNDVPQPNELAIVIE
jgi:endonuclease/exonuclease/phosphatase (EEP) superfamily protein YafD